MKIKNNTVYLCKTHALARQFLQECEKQDYLWVTGEKATQTNAWKRYEEVAFYVERSSLTYGSMDRVAKENTTFLPVIEYKPKPKQTIVIKTDGNTVTAYMGDKQGVAKCNPADAFDLYTGAKLALDRLLGKEDNGVREVKRKAKVGEYIKIVDEDATGGYYKNGDIFKVAVCTVSGVLSAGILVWDSEYVVLENYKPQNK